MRTGQLRVDGRRAKSNQRLEPGQLIRVPPLPDGPAPADRPAISDADIKFLRDAIIHMDDDVIVLNKPPGLPVQGGTGITRHLDGMLDALAFDLPERPKLVHRLDKDTSGILLLGRTVSATAKLAASFRSREARKCYWALTVGVPVRAWGGSTRRWPSCPAYIANAWRWTMTRASVPSPGIAWSIAAHKKAAWLELEPRTGRTHQLRAHCALLHTPIQGDSLYGGDTPMLTGAGISRKLHLHARAIRLPHPRGGILEAVAPLPAHMVSSFDTFGFEIEWAGPAFAAFDEE